MPIVLIGLFGLGAYLLWQRAHPQRPVISVTPASLPPPSVVAIPVPPSVPPVPPLPTTGVLQPLPDGTHDNGLANSAAAAAQSLLSSLPALTAPADPGEYGSRAYDSASPPAPGSSPTIPPPPPPPGAMPQGDPLQQLGGVLGSFGAPGFNGIPTEQTNGVPEIAGAALTPEVRQLIAWALTSATPRQVRDVLQQYGLSPSVRSALNARLQQFQAAGIW